MSIEPVGADDSVSVGDESRYACEQYLDALVTIELAAKLAMIEGRQVNKSIRACWSAIRPRIDNKLNRQIFDGMVSQLMPHGALCMFGASLILRLVRKSDDEIWIPWK